MNDQQRSSAAVRVCTISDSECSRGCGSGACKHETASVTAGKQRSGADALTELLPCPFCGHAAQITMGNGPFFGRAQVECGSCRIATYWYDEAVAVRQWNRRVAASPSNQPAAAPIDDVVGPLRDDQRQHAISLYLNLPHSWESAQAVINSVSADAYVNGRKDAAPAPSPADTPIAYDGLTEEFADEVARLANDAPGIREAVAGALESCKAIIAPQGNTAPSPADERADALYDSAYCAGLQAGFRFGDAGDNDGLRKALESRAGYIEVLRTARAASANDTGAEGFTYATKQATACASCGEHKHTPLRIDWMGGYVCLTCIDRELESRSPAMAAEAVALTKDQANDLLTTYARELVSKNHAAIYPAYEALMNALLAAPQPPAMAAEVVAWIEAEASARNVPLRELLTSMAHSTRLHLQSERPVTDNPVWPIYSHPLSAMAAEAVAWAAVHFGGERDGKVYATCDTKAEVDQYIAQVHQSSDVTTLTARPIAFVDAAPQPAQADALCKCCRLGSWRGSHHPLCDAATPRPPAQAGAREEAYVAKRMTETLASVYATIIGDDKVDDNDGLNAIQRVERAAQVLRLEVDLYRAQAEATKVLTPDEIERISHECVENTIGFDHVKFARAIERAALATRDAGMTVAVRDVLAERRRQIEVEAMTPAGDDQYDRRQLALACASYALAGAGAIASDRSAPVVWPWSHEWWKPTTPRRDLVKSAALALAEIERLDRALLNGAKQWAP